MAPPVSRTHHSSSMPTSQVTTLPPWESNSLEDHCTDVNNLVGMRENSYLNLLSLIQQKAEQSPGLTDCENLRENLELIIRKMPGEIRNREAISTTLNVIEKLIGLTYCSKINQQPYQNRAALYRLHLERITNRLKQTYDFSRLLHLEQMVTDVDRTLLQDLKPLLQNTIQKCRSICNYKFGLMMFAKEHHFSMDQPRQETQQLSTVREEERTARSIYPILSIDGGGIRGIIPATVLVEIERITREPISKLFRSIGGTSTGGILALGLSKPRNGLSEPQYSAQDLLNLYTNQHGSIFQSNPGNIYTGNTPLGLQERVIWEVKNPKYKSLLPFFNGQLGLSTMSTALTDVVIVSNSLEHVITKMVSVSFGALSGIFAFLSGAAGNRNPSFFSHDSIPKDVYLFTKNGVKTLSYSLGSLNQHYPGLLPRHSYPPRRQLWGEEPYSIRNANSVDFPMSLVVTATSAAPSFFPILPLPIDSNDLLMDGGVLQNNPTLPCVLQALNEGHRRQDLFVVSLGTGIAPTTTYTPDLQSNLSSLWFQSTQPDWETEDVLTNILSSGAYHRFQHKFVGNAPGLDDNSQQTIVNLQNAGRGLVENNQELIRDICKILKPGAI